MTFTESEITGDVARGIRQELGMTQSAFWKPLGVQQSVGNRYELTTPIPQSVRILLVARYVSGLPLDTTTRDGVQELARLGSIHAKQAKAKELARDVRTNIEKAAKSLEQARASLSSI